MHVLRSAYIRGVWGRGGVPLLSYMCITFFFNVLSTVSCMRHTNNSQAHKAHGQRKASPIATAITSSSTERATQTPADTSSSIYNFLTSRP